MPKNKRKFSRIPVKVDAELTVGDTSYRVEEILNLGMGGCRLPVTADFEVGTGCHVRILLNAAESEISVDIAGKIKRSTPGTVAVQFTRIDPDSLFHLRNIVRYNCPDADVVDREIRKHPGIR
ncbi:MAG: PilZ domain-containing protein [Desulfobacterales bacterium]|nr:PilZ domain-containing protein [Desulfobacterales bacterium]